MGVVTVGKGGFIYAAFFENGIVKIGCTRYEKKRLKSLIRTSPSELLLFVCFKTNHHNLRQEERLFHGLFSDKQMFDRLPLLIAELQPGCSSASRVEVFGPHLN